MASKLLTGYKIIKGTKRTYKVGLKRAYKQYMKYVYDKSGALKKGIIANRVIPDYDAFVEAYLSFTDKRDLSKTAISKLRVTKKAVQELKLSAKYKIDLKVAKTAIKRLEEYEDQEYSLNEVRKMETTEIAKILAKDIKEDYQRLKAEGKSSTEASKYIAEMYFGS